MILSNVEIHAALDAGKLIIDPEPAPRTRTVGGQYCPYDTSAVDLRLGREIVIPSSGQFTYNLTEPGDLADLISKHSARRQLRDDQPYHLNPHTFVLGETLERVELPIERECTACLAARIEGKSSRARVALLVHFTAPTVHPGFKGTLTLEMINLGPASILLFPEMPIAQLIVEEVKGCPFANPSVFQGQSTPEGLP